MSLWTISSSTWGNSTLGSQPRMSLALEALPTRRSTSAGLQETLVGRYVGRPVVDVDRPEGDVKYLADGPCLASSDNVVAGVALVEHLPHGLHVVTGVAEVPRRAEVTKGQGALPPERDAGRSVGNLPLDELEAPRSTTCQQPSLCKAERRPPPRATASSSGLWTFPMPARSQVTSRCALEGVATVPKPGPATQQSTACAAATSATTTTSAIAAVAATNGEWAFQV